MADDLYTHDILAWSEQQAALLRRLAAGERVNDLDWPNVIEEVESVGRSQLKACRSLLRRAIEHLLKAAAWPDHSAARHWRGEARSFLIDAADAFSPAMRSHLDVTAIYLVALDVCGGMLDGQTAGDVPPSCPFTLDDLLTERPDVAALLRHLSDAPTGGDDAG